MSDYSLEKHAITANTIRGLAMDAVQAANSGHPGMPMGMADVATVLWSQFLTHNPADPKWPNRDRFVLSAGHGSMLLYSLLHLSGYDLPLDELKQFRQWNSKTPGHPEFHLTPGVETTTGPLGQGITNAIGMALAEEWLAAKFNREDHTIIDHYTYVIASDGDLQEGISSEASSLAGHLELGKLVVLYDDNEISIDGPTRKSFSEDVLARYEAYGWHTQRVDGHDPAEILEAIQTARAVTDRPSIVACRTTIGFGSPNMGGTAKVHGSPLGDEEVKLSKQNLGIPVEPLFYVPDEATAFLAADDSAQQAWNKKWEAYKEAYPELAAEFQGALDGDLPSNWDEILPSFEVGKSMATRASSGQALNAIAPSVPTLLGGSADLTPSNKTDLKGEDDVTPGDFSGRYLRFGVREHAMAGIMNGMAYHGGIRPYGGTFLVFSDYMRGSMRLSALSDLPVIYVLTHDSIGVGEDGPTHQPIEHVMALRLIPNMTVIRPGDAKEVAYAWQSALQNIDGPTVLALSRQGVPTLAETGPDALKGGYVLRDVENPQVILIGTGTELHLTVEAQEKLAEKGVAARVVSLPSWELFEKQSDEYKESVLPSAVTARVSIEAGVTTGWQKYVGLQGKAIGIDHFGASAPGKVVFEKFGITAEALVDAALALVA